MRPRERWVALDPLRSAERARLFAYPSSPLFSLAVSELLVPKRRVAVELVAPSGERRTVTVFLSEFSAERSGPERVSDVLARAEAFFPALDHATDTVSFVNRAGVALARVPRELEEGSVDSTTIPTEHDVEVTLLGGQVVRGLLSYVLAPEHSRVGDFLNLPDQLFRLIVSADEVLLVNKQHVARVALVSR